MSKYTDYALFLAEKATPHIKIFFNLKSDR